MLRRVVVVGATGRLGRRVLAEVAGSGSVLAVGRRRSSLRDVAAAHDVQAAMADAASLRAVLHPGDVVVSCVDPSGGVGGAVLDAATGCHATYVDGCGEPAWMREVQALGPAARRDAATVVPGVGHPGVPGLLLAEQVVGALGGAPSGLVTTALLEGPSQVHTTGGRRAVARALTQPTTTWAAGTHREEAVGSRTRTVTVDGRTWRTISVGGPEVWWLPARHPGLREAEVHAGWGGPLGQLLGVAGPAAGMVGPLTGPLRVGLVDRLLDTVAAVPLGGPDGGTAPEATRYVVEALDARGEVVARRQAVAGNPVVVTARLLGAVALRLAAADLRYLPTGVVDPAVAVGLAELDDLARWAGLVDM